jgi:hypothetical protein
MVPVFIFTSFLIIEIWKTLRDCETHLLKGKEGGSVMRKCTEIPHKFQPFENPEFRHNAQIKVVIIYASHFRIADPSFIPTIFTKVSGLEYY